MANDSDSSLAILVVDDNRDAADTLSLLLQVIGHRTAVAYDGLSAVDIALAFKPDVAIFDLDMPGLGGCDALKAWKEREPSFPAFVICLTGNGEHDVKVRCMEAGFRRFLTKPLMQEELDAVLRVGLDEKANRVHNPTCS